MRLLAILIAAAIFAGCQSSQPTNPFLRTTVPPPGTGQAGLPNAEPYYPAGVPPVGAAPQTPSATGSAPPASSKYAPPGGFNLPQSSVDRGKAVNPGPADLRAGGSALARLSTPAKTAAAPAAGLAADGAKAVSVTPTAGGSGVVQAAFTEPAPARAAASIASIGQRDVTSVARISSDAEGGSRIVIRDTGSTATLAARNGNESAPPTTDTRAGPTVRLTAGEPATEITDLPKADTGTPATVRSRIVAETEQTTFAVQSPSDSTAAATTLRAPATTSSQYAFTPSYESLSGQLEYSQTTQRWKLRYIPITGQTDQYGGSVMIEDATLLKGYKAGDYVSVQGAISGKGPAGQGFAPLFQLRHIESQK